MSDVVFDKVVLVTMRRSERRTMNYQEIFFIKASTSFEDKLLMILMKLRLHFLFTNLSQDFEIYLVALAHTFFYSWARNNLLKIICDVKSKVVCSYNRYENNISNHFQNV